MKMEQRQGDMAYLRATKPCWAPGAEERPEKIPLRVPRSRPVTSLACDMTEVMSAVLRQSSVAEYSSACTKPWVLSSEPHKTGRSGVPEL